MKLIAAVSTLGFLLAACGSVVESETGLLDPVDQTTTSTTIGGATTTQDLNVDTTIPDESELIAAAVEDLAQRLSVPEDSVGVVEAKAVTWPDGSLGCPKDGQLYTQAIVDGTQVLLDSGGRIYDYHLGPDGRLVFCPSGDKDGGYDFVPPPGFND